SEEAPETEEPSTETPQEQVEVPDTEAPQQPVIKTVDEKTGEITGESEANAKIIVTIPDRSEVTTTADAEGKWTVTITPSMSSMELTIKAVDAAGNTSETVTETMQSTIIPVVEAPEIEEPEIETPEVEVPVIEEPETEVPSTEVPQEQVEMPDTEAPQQPVIKTVDAKTGEITGESEANAKIIVTLPNGNEVMTTASAEGKWSVNITSQTFSRNLLVKAVDAAGNTSESVSATMKATIITEIEAPSEETPATEEPSTETPATEEPSTETPATEEPSEETPATEEPSEETPAAEEPSEETPATEEPSTETPATEEPSTETPQEQVEVPDTEAPQQPVIKTVDEKTGEITGESEANAKIIVTLPDRSEVTTTADAEGKWTVTITPSMSSMELTIKAVDAAGNTSESVTETMQSTIIPVVEEPEIETPEVEEPEIETPQEQVEEPVTETPETEIPQEQVEVPDTEAPQQPVIKMVNAKTGEITGESEANAKIIVTLSDGSEVTTTANGEGKWTVKITPSMSSMELRIKAIDAAGNTSESVTATMESMIIPVIEEPEIETPEVEVPVIEEPETEVPSTEVPQEQVEVPDTEAPQQPVIKTVDEKTGEISG
ncbi:Ig-like domain-containing protein, partial [Niallia taxi]|uniref:Ig-like domain-containing protein n=1 Tax=Niallia taxi TaxID=2499688 RepID=UPI003D2701F8